MLKDQTSQFGVIKRLNLVESPIDVLGTVVKTRYVSNAPVQFFDTLDMVPNWEPIGLLYNLVHILAQPFSCIHLEHGEKVENDALVKLGLVLTSCYVVFHTVDIGVGLHLSLLFHDWLPCSLLIFSQKVIIKLEGFFAALADSSSARLRASWALL